MKTVTKPARESSVEGAELEKCEIAIFKDTVPKGAGAYSNPDLLKEVFTSAGHKVTFLDVKTLGKFLTKKKFDILVLPYGEAFPRDAKKAFLQFLKDGGNFISMGGYAFSRGLSYDADGKLVLDKKDLGITTRTGKPKNDLWVEPEQIGIFDPSYRLMKVARVNADKDQYIIDSNLIFDMQVRGYAACAMTGIGPRLHGGPEGARWIPLMRGYDAYGRLRGSVGSLVYNYNNELYTGSAWCYFGVDSHDLFTSGDKRMEKVLLDVVNYMMTGLYLHETMTEYSCYYPGESVNLITKLSNSGNESRDVRIIFQVLPLDTDEVFKEAAFSLRIKPGATREISAVWKPERFEIDFYRIRVSLLMNGKVIDSQENGFTVWDEKVIKSGPAIDFKDNYFTIDGHPRLLTGSKMRYPTQWTAGSPFNPLELSKDLQMMRDWGVDVYAPLTTGFTPDVFRSKGMKYEIYLRNTDTLIQLCQKYRVPLFLGLLHWLDDPEAKQGVDMPINDDKELMDLNKRYCKFMAKRYKDVPGLFWMLHGDIPTVTTKKFQWWTKEIREALNSQGREYLMSIETWSGTVDDDRLKYLDFACTSGLLSEFAKSFKLFDARVFGKSLTVGEFGVHTHPAWGFKADDVAWKAQMDKFGDEFHFGFGVGGSLIVNWQWKDEMEAVFPWGLIFPCERVPKPILKMWRLKHIFFSSFRPKYVAPSLYYVRLSVPDFSKGYKMTRNFFSENIKDIGRLFDVQRDFGVIAHTNLDKLRGRKVTLVSGEAECIGDWNILSIDEFIKTPEGQKRVTAPSQGIFVHKQFTENNGIIYYLYNCGEKRNVQLLDKPVSVMLDKNKPGIVFIADGKVRALETQGPVSIGGKVVLNTTCHIMTYTLDSKGIVDSKQIVLLPVTDGMVKIKSLQGWKKPVSLVGEMRNGKWVTMDSIQTHTAGGAFVFDVSNGQKLNTLLITEASNEKSTIATYEKVIAF